LVRFFFLSVLWFLPISVCWSFGRITSNALRTGKSPPDNQVHPKLFWFGIFLSILLFSIFLSLALIGTFGFIATAMR
jgi:nitrate reductase NapE component